MAHHPDGEPEQTGKLRSMSLEDAGDWQALSKLEPSDSMMDRFAVGDGFAVSDSQTRAMDFDLASQNMAPDPPIDSLEVDFNPLPVTQQLFASTPLPPAPPVAAGMRRVNTAPVALKSMAAGQSLMAGGDGWRRPDTFQPQSYDLDFSYNLTPKRSHAEMTGEHSDSEHSMSSHSNATGEAMASRLPPPHLHAGLLAGNSPLVPMSELQGVGSLQPLWPERQSAKGIKRVKSAPVALSSLADLSPSQSPVDTYDMDAPSTSASKPKSQDRLARKAEAARASRRRKKQYIESLEQQVEALTKELAELESNSAKPKGSVESMHREDQQGFLRAMTEKLHLTERGSPGQAAASPVQLQAELRLLTDTFITNSRRRQACASQYIAKLKQFVEPTLHLQFVLWALDQQESFYADPRGAWHNVMKTQVGLSDQQLSQLLALQPEVRSLRTQLNSVQRKMAMLAKATEQQLASRHKHLDTLRGLLNPVQLARFLTWVEHNPLLIQMLDTIWKKS